LCVSKSFVSIAFYLTLSLCTTATVVACNILTDIGGSGATFEMVGFQEQFGWRCPGADAPHTDYGDCVAKTVGQIDREKGLINGLFGAGAAM
jgi:hypothetical protein